MVYGGIERELLQLNEDTLYSGMPHRYDNPRAFEYLAEVRRLVLEGEYAEAQELAENMLGVPKYQAAYQPLCDLTLEFSHIGPTQDYRRSLDLTTGVLTVEFRAGEAWHRREAFVSYPDQVLVVRMSCSDKKSIGFSLSLASSHPTNTTTLDGVVMSLSGTTGPRRCVEPIAAQNRPGLSFETRAAVHAPGGSTRAEHGRLIVEGADSAVILVAAATSFIRYNDISGNPTAKNDVVLHSAQGKPFAALYDDHQTDFRKLHGRVALELPDPAGPDTPIDERLERVRAGKDDPFLAALLFQYGRYLLISSSRPGSQAANLQGIWNPLSEPPWGSKYTININIQMNYWQAETCNLPECAEPLFQLIEELSETGSRTAEIQYHAPGWVAHHNTDIWRGSAPVDGAAWGMWPMAGAWLCRHLWEHYLYTRSTDALRRFYPVLREACEFYLEFLSEDEQGYLYTNPSMSPEHGHKDGTALHREGSTICAGPTVDAELLRDLFAAGAESARILERDVDFRSRAVAARERLLPFQIGRHGQLQEWREDWDNPEDTHGHVSHLYALYPSEQINPKDTPELAKACAVTLTHRGPHRGWPGAWYTALWARLGEPEEAYENLMGNLIPELNHNLLNWRKHFQIDANMGASAAIAEMLLQSHLGELDMLPALPPSWANGCLRGLRAKGGFEVDLNWKDGVLTAATVFSRLGGPCTVRYKARTLEFATEPNGKYEISVDAEGHLDL